MMILILRNEDVVIEPLGYVDLTDNGTKINRNELMR